MHRRKRRSVHPVGEAQGTPGKREDWRRRKERVEERERDLSKLGN